MKNSMRTLLVAVLSLGLLALPTAASADDDRKTRTGKCSGPATYRMTVRELDDDKLRIRFFVNTSSKNKTWKVRAHRNGNLVAKGTPTTNRYGNFTFVRTVRGDDDDFIRVRAVSPTGQVCARGFRIDG
ncbi:MAG TPA: hypothetical protein VM307_07290 [Egibacteraceae bacterium]|nr:hypothetical protein [Egibacteraceae bacterium]